MIECDDPLKATWRLFGNRTRHCLRRLARAERHGGDKSRAQTFMLLQVASASLEQGLPLRSVEHVAISAATHMTLEIQRKDRKTVFQSLSQESQAKVLRLKEIEDERDDFRADESTQFYMGPIRAKRRNKTLQDPSSWDWQVEAGEAELEDTIRKRERARLRRKSRWSMLIDGAVYLRSKKFGVSRISVVVAVSADALFKDLLEIMEFEKAAEPDDPRSEKKPVGRRVDPNWPAESERDLLKKFRDYEKELGGRRVNYGGFYREWLAQTKFTDSDNRTYFETVSATQIRDRIDKLKAAEEKALREELEFQGQFEELDDLP